MTIRFAALGAVLVLAGCASVTSETAIFPPQMNAPALAGPYSFGDIDGSAIAMVSRKDAASYSVSLYSTKPHWMQGAAADLSAVPLGNGDYVLQVSCYADRDDKTKDWKRNGAGFQYWMMAAARPRGDYWIGIASPDDATAGRLAAKYRQAVGQYGEIKLSDISPALAKAFFRDWTAAILAAGEDRVAPILSVHDWSAPSGEPEFDHPKQCTDVPFAKS